MNARPHVLFFSRGKGRGHAVPDAAIANDLVSRDPEVIITFASYGMGAATLKALGWNTIDLDLPEHNPIWETVVKATRVLHDVRPTLVVSHEEGVVLPLAKAAGLPTIFLTDWFSNGESVHMQALKFADEIIFLDDAGYQDVPRYLTDKIVYVGAVLQNGRADGPGTDECRALLGVPHDATLIVVVPGGATTHSEALAPILDLVLPAYDKLRDRDDRGHRLIWVAGGVDHAHIAGRVTGRPDIVVMKPHPTIARTMRAANLVITKGNRITTLECEALGVPSISISFGANPPDDHRVARIRTNIALRAKGLDDAVLTQRMIDGLTFGRTLPRDAVGVPSDVLDARCRAVVDRMQEHLQRYAHDGGHVGVVPYA
jgi:UDP-N-acetylglucosamine:LPS N-acetylglucosamine transferase